MHFKLAQFNIEGGLCNPAEITYLKQQAQYQILL